MSECIRQADLVRVWGMSRQRISEYVKEGMPLTSVADAEAWRTARYGASGSKIKNTSPVLNGDDEPCTEPDEQTLKRSDLVGLKARVDKQEMDAYKQLQDARMSNNYTDIMRALKQHEECAKIKVGLAKDLIDAEMKRGVLCTVDEAKKMIGNVLGAMRIILIAMPESLSHRVNPADPDHARKELQDWLEKFNEQMRRSGAAFYA